MAEILGLGCTHRPVMLRRDEDWTFMMRASLDDPDMPAEWKDPSRWPAQLRDELANDFGTAAAGRARKVFRRHFAETRRALDEFKPDVIVMFGDDQYENFKEDIVPPFAALAYEDQDIQPWKHRRSNYNPWNEPPDATFRLRGHQDAGKCLASGLIEAGSTPPMPTSRCTTSSATPSKTRSCCSTTSGSDSTIQSCRFP
jgi:hypothetical protein